MTKLITAFTLFVLTFISAQGQQSVVQRAQDNLNKEWKSIWALKQGKVPKLIYSKELPLLNLANGYPLLRSFGKTTAAF
jgi:endonuclease III